MKLLQINLQTTLILTSGDDILGAYNEHTALLVFNKPLAKCYDNTVEMMVKLLGTKNLVVGKVYPSDSFGINFYDHRTGGTSEFHDVRGVVLETYLSKVKIKDVSDESN